MFLISYFPSSHIPKLGNFRGPIFPISYKDCALGSLFHAHVPYSEFHLRHIHDHVPKLFLREPSGGRPFADENFSTRPRTHW